MTRVRKLTLVQREMIRALREARFQTKVIARQFGVSPRAVEWHLYPKVRETERRRAACR